MELDEQSAGYRPRKRYPFALEVEAMDEDDMCVMGNWQERISSSV